MTPPAPAPPASPGSAAYRPAARALHWGIALLIGVVVPVGMYCAGLRGVAGRESDRDALLFWHKSFGLLILGLAAARLLYRWRVPPPPPPVTHSRLERRTARAVHVILYALLFLAPLSGLLLSQGAGQPVSVFGLLTLPQMIPIDIAVPPQARPEVQAGALLHKGVFKTLLLAALALHLVGVIKHVWIDRDRSFFPRMWGPRVSVRDSPRD